MTCRGKLVVMMAMNLCFISAGLPSNNCGLCFKQPTFVSSRTVLEAQTSQSEGMFEHELQVTPVKVDVQVSPEADLQSIFPGTGSAQRDDDESDPYGGVVYKYDDAVVKVYVPNRKDGFANGSTIYTGGNVWSGPAEIKENRAKVRVRVWSPMDFPCPDYVTTSPVQVQAGPGTKAFVELAHGLGTVPEYVTVQVRHGSTKWVSDGIGYVMTSSKTSINTSWGGVLYAYNESHIRIWIPSTDSGSWYSTADGWGRASNDIQNSGRLIVKMWKFFNGADLFSKTNDIGSRAASIVKEMPFPSTLDIENGLLSVMVKSTEGQNANFRFPATGAVQNAQQTGSYGGLVYSYSTSGIRLWQPPRSHGYLIYINNIWGGGAVTQSSNAAQLVVQAWDAYTICPATVATLSTTKSPTSSAAVKPPTNKTAVSGGALISSSNGQLSYPNSHPSGGQSNKTNSPLTNKQRGSSVVTMDTSTKSHVPTLKGGNTSRNDATHDQFKGLFVRLPWWAVGVAGGVTLLLVIGSISGVVQCIQRTKAKGKVEAKDKDGRAKGKDRGSRFPAKGKDKKEAKIQAWDI